MALLLAIGVVTGQKPGAIAYCVLIGVLGSFLDSLPVLLNAQFLAAVNIIVYAGAIMVLFLFVIMFLNLNKETEPHKPALAKFAAAIAGSSLLLILVAAMRNIQPAGYDPANFDSQIGMVDKLGMVLFRDYALPFELASILLLAAMVGSVMLGKRETGERNF